MNEQVCGICIDWFGGGDCTKCEEEEHDGRNDTCERDACRDKADK